MKKIILIGLIFWTATGKSQNTAITTTLLVKGNCEECKTRIENAADIKGVKFFEWNTVLKNACRLHAKLFQFEFSNNEQYLLF